MSEIEARKTQQRVYIGKRLVNNKVVHAFKRLDENGEFIDGDTRFVYFEKNVVSNSYVGAVYKFTFSTDEKVYTGGDNKPMYEGVFHDMKLVTAWQAEDKAAFTESRHAAALKADSRKYDYFAKCLEPIKIAMRNANPIERKIIIAEVLAELDGWRRP